MSVRLSELAKELGTTKKDLLEKLPALGFELKKSVVDVEDHTADEIKVAVRKSGVSFDAPVKKVVRKTSIGKKKAAKVAAEKATAKKKKKKKVVAEPEAAEPTTSAVTTSEPSEVAPTVPVVPVVPVSEPAPPVAAVQSAPSVPSVPSVQVPTITTPAPRPPRPAEPERPVARPAATPPKPRRPPARPHAEAPGSRAAASASAPDARPGDGDDRRPVPEPLRSTPKAPRAFVRPGGRKKGRRGRQRGGAPPPQMTPMPSVHRGPLREVTLSEGITVKDFCEKLSIRTRDVIKALMERGIFATINQSLEKDVAEELAKRFGFEASIVSFEEESVVDEEIQESAEDLESRPPVVTVMGHVDHGKTSLLDAIRETNVAGREAGQITQHIGAYQVEKKGRLITFLDTPGHEAFTRMRSRGASVTDIVVLVVAADDGVMPQTIEAIHHAQEAGVPIIVAVNKIDLPGANPDRVLQMLADRGLLAEAYGGQTVTVQVSAKKKTGLDQLLELILLSADILELKANPSRTATGVVLEAKLEKGRGAVATALVQRGTLRLGDSLVAGAIYGKVRAMVNAYGERVDVAGPSTPVEILGLQTVPNAGDVLQVVDDAKARQIGSFRQQKLRDQQLARSSRLTLNQLYKQIAEGEVAELPLILKGDVQGSVEALSDMLQKLSTDKVKIRIIHSGAGAITETDVLLASASNAIIIGFSVRPERKAEELAQQEKVDIRLHTIIYNVTAEIEAAMKGLLEPTFREVVIGHAEVRQLFRVPKVGVIAGCSVLDGRITRDSQVRLLRDNVVVFEGKLSSLRRFKDDAAEVRTGFECGMSIANYQDLKEGDVIEAFKNEQVEPEI